MKSRKDPRTMTAEDLADLYEEQFFRKAGEKPPREWRKAKPRKPTLSEREDKTFPLLVEFIKDKKEI